MANYKRRKCRANAINARRGSTASWRAKHGMKPARIRYDDYWPDNLEGWRRAWEPNYLGQMNGWAAWWDRVFHTRPKRTLTKRLERKVLRDEIDPDNLAWPLGNRKPHNYYW